MPLAACQAYPPLLNAGTPRPVGPLALNDVFGDAASAPSGAQPATGPASGTVSVGPVMILPAGSAPGVAYAPMAAPAPTRPAVPALADPAAAVRPPPVTTAPVIVASAVAPRVDAPQAVPPAGRGGTDLVREMAQRRPLLQAWARCIREGGDRLAQTTPQGADLILAVSMAACEPEKQAYGAAVARDDGATRVPAVLDDMAQFLSDRMGSRIQELRQARP